MTVHDSVGSNVASADGQFTPQLSGVELQLQTKEDAEQVRQAFTAVIADLEPLCVQQEEALRAALQEIDELKRRLARERNTKRAATEEEHDQAVELLTQAQALADQLIDDAQAESRDMMLAARALQRKALEERKAVEDLQAAAVPVGVETGADDATESDGERRVRSLAKVAKTQFYAVLDALREEIDHLEDTGLMSLDAEMRQVRAAGDRPSRLLVAESRPVAR